MSSALEVALGHLELECKHAGLRLHLACLARFNLSHADNDTDALRERLTDSLLSKDQYKHPWVSFGRNVKLVISVYCELDGAQAVQNALVDVLADGLKDSEFWAQLAFSPASVQTKTGGTGDLHLLAITLEARYVRQQDASKSSICRLGHDIPIHHVKPPDGIEAVDFESAHIAIRISSFAKDHKSDSQDNAPTLRDGAVCRDGDSGSQMYGDGFPEMLLDFQDECILTEPITNFEFHLTPPHDMICESDLLMNCDDDPKDSCQTLLLDQISNGCETTCLPSHTSVNGNEQVNSALQLIDLALRHVLCEPPLRTPRSILITSDKLVQRLPSLAPPIWSPGYLAAIAGRSAFLPTISHALMRVSEVRTRSQCTEKRVVEKDGYVENDSEASAGHQRLHLQMAIKRRLWAQLQTQVFDKKAAYRSKPILPMITTHEINISTSTDLLDDWQDHPRTDDRSEAAETELLLPDEIDDISDEEEFLLDSCDLDLQEARTHDAGNFSNHSNRYYELLEAAHYGYADPAMTNDGSMIADELLIFPKDASAGSERYPEDLSCILLC